MTTTHTDVHTLLLLLMALVSAVAILAGAARRLSISYPIVLVIAGLVCSFLPHVPRVPLSPDVIFFVFLPPLLFSAAWQTSWREFRYNIISISMLAIGLVFFTAFGVALTAHYFMPGFDWRAGFLLGAVVSPTDAVAATSIAKRVGLPQRIVDILEGESLLNDATGLLALEFGVQMIVDGRVPTVTAGVFRLLWLLGGGVLAGWLIGIVIRWFERWVDDGPVEIAITLIVCYSSYLVGEAIHASGVIAVVSCGLYLSRQSSQFFSAEVRLQATSVWEALEFLLNGLVFLLLGLQLPYILADIRGYSIGRLILYGLVFSAVLVALRLIWVFPGAMVSWQLRRRLQHQQESHPPSRAVFALGWTGMRGVVALAAAFSLPYTLADGTPFVQRNLIVFLTFAVILVTLVGQGLTLPALVRALGLAKLNEPECEEGEARRILLRVAMEHLTAERAECVNPLDMHAYDDLLHQYEHRLEEIEDCGPGQPATDRHARSVSKVLRGTVTAEREELIRLRDSGRIGDAVRRRLERELDLSESRLIQRG